jgi:arylsulfatase A-like enzyme
VPRRVILISIDDLRFDALSCVEETRYLDRFGLAAFRDTPQLDALAARGVRFTQAVSTCSYTPPSHATMLTGRFPPAHGVRAFLVNPLPQSVPTLAEEMARGGYETVAAIDFGPMFTLLGLDRGFSTRFSADDQALLAHVRERRDEPLFLFMHIGDVHPPVGESFDEPRVGYNEESYAELERLASALGLVFAPLPDAGPERRSAAVALSNRVRTWADDRGVTPSIELPRYLAGVNKFDTGRLAVLLESFEREGLLDDALLIVLSDHGQGTIPGWSMGDTRTPVKFDHGEVLLEELIRIPLIVAGAGVVGGRTVDAQVSLADVAPTIADWARVDPPEGAQGRSFLPALVGEAMDDSVAYAEVWYHDRLALGRYLKRCLAAGELLSTGYETFLHQRAVRTPSLKYVMRGSELTEEDWSLPDTEFVHACFQKLVARVASFDVIAELAGQLRDGVLTRPRLVEDLQLRDANREALYNLADDPHETANLLLVDRSLAVVGVERDHAAIAEELARTAARIEAGGPLLGSDLEHGGTDMALIESRLRDLGYVE